MTMFDRRFFLTSSLATGLLASCGQGPTPTATAQAPEPGFGTVEAFDPAFWSIIDQDARIDTLATGFTWSEGPTWDQARNALYFSDVPKNIAYRWTAAQGAVPFLTPSGIPMADAAGFREPGSNGLWWVSESEMLICNHGRRAIESYDFATGARTELIGAYEGQRLNSPNDLVRTEAGDLYFTDPPYGLEGLDASPLKELDANGVYHLSAQGALTRLVEDMTFPNGVGLSPDGQFLYVAQSDPTNPYIRRLTLDAQGAVTEDVRWFDASDLLAAGDPGLPDGMAIATTGHVFATGPGGVLVLDPDGALLGRLNLGQPTGNCTFGEDGRSLFITSGDRLLRVRTSLIGMGFMGMEGEG